MNTTELVLSVFGVFLLAAMYEGMNVIRTKTDAWIDARARERIRKKNNAYNPESANNTCNCPCASDSNSKGAATPPYSASNIISSIDSVKEEEDLPLYYEWSEQLLRAAIHAIHTFYALFIMMLFMTYNGFLNIALIFGAFTGFLLFQRKRGSSVKKATSCH